MVSNKCLLDKLISMNQQARLLKVISTHLRSNNQIVTNRKRRIRQERFGRFVCSDLNHFSNRIEPFTVKESQTTDDIYPADVSEFTDYLRRGKITGLRTLVRSVFSCPKVKNCVLLIFCHFMYFYRLWRFLSNWIKQMIYPQ